MNNLPECKCGCRNKVRKIEHEFIYGHHRKGVKFSEEHKAKIKSAKDKYYLSHSSPMLGKKLTKKQRLKISKTLKGRKLSNEHRANLSANHQGMTGKKHLKETKIKIGIGNMKLGLREYCCSWYDEEYINDCRKKACQKCGLTNMLSLKVYGCQLDNHHLFGSQECRPEDIQTLCKSCHLGLHRRDGNRKRGIEI